MFWNKKPNPAPLGVPLGNLMAGIAPTTIKDSLKSDTLIPQHEHYGIRVEIAPPAMRESENSTIRRAMANEKPRGGSSRWTEHDLAQIEMAPHDLPPHFGAWCPRQLDNSPAYVTFLPNALHSAPDRRQHRLLGDESCTVGQCHASLGVRS